MTWARIPLAVFLMLHGIGHSIWFIGAWIPAAKLVGAEPWILGGRVTLQSPIGHIMGLAAGVAMVGFAAAGWGLWTGADWWRPLVLLSAAVSVVSVLPWLHASPGTTVLNATLANVALAVFVMLPLSRQLIEA